MNLHAIAQWLLNVTGWIGSHLYLALSYFCLALVLGLGWYIGKVIAESITKVEDRPDEPWDEGG